MNTITVDLSITIASYNTLDYTRHCLESIFTNTKDITFEVIIVDNGSKDGSPDMIKSEFPQVRLICNNANLGIPAVTNMGISLSRGRYFITMNSDVIVYPGSLEKLVEFMDSHPDAGAAAAKLILPPDKKHPYGEVHPLIFGNPPTLKSELLDVFTPFSRYIARAAKKTVVFDQIDTSKTQEVPCITWGTAFIVRRDVLETVGGQDPVFFVYCEDTDWSMRISKAGWKLYYIADAVIIHDFGKSTGQTSADSMARLCRNRCRLIGKHYGQLSGLILRLAFMTVFGSYITRWVIPYLLIPSKRSYAGDKISRSWKIIRAVTT